MKFIFWLFILGGIAGSIFSFIPQEFSKSTSAILLVIVIIVADVYARFIKKRAADKLSIIIRVFRRVPDDSPRALFFICLSLFVSLTPLKHFSKLLFININDF